MSIEQYYTKKEISELLKVTIKTIDNYIKKGNLKAIKIGGNVRISESSLQEFLNQYEIK